MFAFCIPRKIQYLLKDLRNRAVFKISNHILAETEEIRASSSKEAKNSFLPSLWPSADKKGKDTSQGQPQCRSTHYIVAVKAEIYSTSNEHPETLVT